MNIKKIVLFAVITVIFISLLWLINYPPLPPPAVSGWLTYFDFPDAFKSFKNNAAIFNEVNPFIYAFDKDGAIIKSGGFSEVDLNNIISVARQNKIKVIPTIVNDVIAREKDSKDILKDPGIIHLLLEDDSSTKKHIEAILNLVKNAAIDGIEIDYENIDAKDREQFVKFIKLLSGEIHRNHKILNLDLEAKFIDDKKPFFTVGELLIIGDFVDTLKIMCYPLHGPFSQPGPVSTASWIRQILKDALTKVPKNKICIALALHGFDWSKKGVSRVSYKKAFELATKHNSKILRTRDKIPHFSYFENGIKHDVWFEDTKSIAAKIQAASKYGVNNIALWRLSGENEGIYNNLRKAKTYIPGRR